MKKLLRNSIGVLFLFMLLPNPVVQAQTLLSSSLETQTGIAAEGLITSSPSSLYATSPSGLNGTMVPVPKAYKDLLTFYEPSGVCDSDVPFIVVDFTDDPDGSFYLTDDFRNGFCCGITGGGNRCFEVLLILSDQTAAVSINLAGATATGAADWWLTPLPAEEGSCASPSYKIGDQVCIAKGGMYALSFCKPGQNNYELVINSHAVPAVPEFEVRQDCSTELNVVGFQESTITWSGDFAGALDFSTGPGSPTFTWVEGMPLFPDYVEFNVCGQVSALESCTGYVGEHCETAKVYVYPEIEAAITPEAPLFCEDGMTEIAAAISGGKPPYQIQWINPLGQVAGTASTIMASLAGQWTLIVSDELTGDGCPAAAFYVEVTQVSLSLSAMVEAVNCFDGNDGSIVAEVSGGTEPLQYLWSHDASLNAPAAYNLAAGEYTLTVIDANGCQAEATFMVGQPAEELEAMVSQIVHENCAGANDGAANFNVSGGTPPYTLNVTDEYGQPIMLDGTTESRMVTEISRSRNAFQIAKLNKSLLASGNFSVSNLAPGTYSVSVVDANGCEDQTSFTIEPGAEVLASITADGDLAFCEGGAVELTASEGASYLWSTGETTQSIVVATSGTYNVTVFSEAGCEGSASVEVVVYELPQVSLAAFDGICHDTPAFELSGGMPAGGVYSGTGVTNGMFDPQAASAGTFEITYTFVDENGCSNTATASITVYELPQVSLAAFEAICGDAPAFELSGGMPQGGVYSGTGVTNGMFDPQAAGAGSFEITYTFVDENGCSSFATASISVYELPVVTLAPLADVCEHGPSFMLEGGMPAGGVYSGPGVVDGMFDPTLVGAGTWEITYTFVDENGCSNAATASIFVKTMYAFYDVVDAGCFGESNGAIYLEVHNGNGTYTYLWSNGATTQNLENIPAGEYSVEISDGINCMLYVSGIVVSESTEIVISGVVTQVSAFDMADGAIVTSVSGGNAPYSYAWSNGETTPNLFNLAAGTYVLTVTDEDGCQATAEFVIAEGEILVDLQVTIEVNIATPDPAEVDELIFALVVTNLNPSIDATGVSVENMLPNVFPFIIRIDDGSHGTYNPENGIWTIGTIPPGGYAMLVYSTGMLLSEAIPSAVNAAQILPFDQEDPNLDNNYDEVVVTIGESTGGDDGGIESDGNMASQIALRQHKRMVESRHIESENRVKEMPAFSINDMLVGNIMAATMEGTPSTGISYFIPEHGPAQTRAFISTPADLLAITNANEIFAVDYLQQNNSRRAAILAIATDPGTVYEHTKVICDRLTGASLEEIRHIQIAGQPFILSKLVHPNGYVDYAVSFIATWRNNGFTIDNRWHNELYNPNGTEEVFNFQVWSVTPQFTRELVEDILTAMGTAGQLQFRNANSMPQIPQVYVQNGKYRNGKLLLNLVNTNGASKITLYGSKAVVENGGRTWFEIEVDIPTTATSSVEVPTGFIFDAGFSIANNRDNARDVLYYADGPWMFDYDPGNSVVTHFSTEAEDGILHDRSYNIERNASMKGNVRTYASMFRRLGPGNLPMDMTQYNQVAFHASGVGTVEVMIAKSSIHAWNEQYRSVITLDPNGKDYSISFSDLRNAEGQKGFTADDVISVIFNPIGNGSQASPFEVNVSNLHFTNHLIETNDAGIFYTSYPNPFRHTTSMEFVLTSEGQVKIEVMNLLGQTMEIVKDEYMQQGSYKIDWTPQGMKPGIYMYRITIGDQAYSGKMIYQP
ncbi:MAG: T9SS type A sorting domain-containing protein [Bacteroidales bacterium]|nr:T9SS type A sorting domain-containing protein [Bacteroidales bacterium]